MNEGKTKEQDGLRSFEERVISMLIELRQDMNKRFDALDARVAVLEAKSYDTKPIWERALSEILGTRREVRETKIELRLMRADFARARVEHELLSDPATTLEERQRRGEQSSGGDPSHVAALVHRACNKETLNGVMMTEPTLTAIYEEAEEGGYIGYIAELPGANTQGETLEEVRENLIEATQMILEVNRRGEEEA